MRTKQVCNKVDKNVQNWKEELKNTMQIFPNFITIEEENSLMKEIESCVKRLRYEQSHWDDAIHAYRETEQSKWNEDNLKIINKIREKAFPKGMSQIPLIHILDLAPEGWIKPHIDSTRFCGEIIAGLSLLSDSVMRLTLVGNETLYKQDFLLPRRSLYIMSFSITFLLQIAHSKGIFKERKPLENKRKNTVCDIAESNAQNEMACKKRKIKEDHSLKKTEMLEINNKENTSVNKSKNVLDNLNEKKQLHNVKSVESNIRPPINLDSIKKCKSDVKKESGILSNNVSEQSDEIRELNCDLISYSLDDCFEEEWFTDKQINLNSLQRCKIIDMKKECSYILLTVINFEFEMSSTIVKCSGFWKDVKVEINDIIAIEARKENEYWVVDNNSGYIVIHPDLLISGTTIVSGLFCSRKAILAEKFRKIESLPYFKGDQTAIVIGCLAHQLLQKAVLQDIHKLSDITELLNCILESKETINMLYAAGVPFDTCKEEMLLFVPKIFKFIQHYLKSNKQEEISNIKDNFQGRITHIRDIEENIWLPKLGIKGKVDITAEVQMNSRRKIVPIEVKTGKPSFSLEHKGQIILYIMMMALTGQDTDTGLLLYLRENSMQIINSGHPERRDLILLRNVLANYFAKPVGTYSNSISDLQWQTLNLPEPINHHSACSKCPYNALCCAYLRKDTELQLSESHPLMKLSKQILDKFKPSHINYVLQWISLLQMEQTAQSNDNSMVHLWTLSPDKREMKKACICNLKIIGKVKEYNAKYHHTFIRESSNIEEAENNIPYMEFTENEYVLVSTNTRINISAGFIAHISKNSVVVMLDRDITKYNSNESFHIDKYSSSNLFSLNLANVGGLMGDDEICAKLRDIVIDRKPATFDKGVPQSIICRNSKILHGLNESQQRAVLKALTANNYMLIKGMPGTGKTQTLIALIELLHEIGQSVLITSHTNSAVDNILLKLLDKNIEFLRLGSSSIHPSLKSNSERYATAKCCTLEDLETAYSKNIVGVTCYGAHHALLGKRIFDVCIVDESAQTMQPTTLRPLYNARKFVLVGDPDQLPPIVKSNQARKLGADESLFVRLDSENNTVILTEQYRMNKYIMNLANKLTYNDRLKAGNNSIENAVFNAGRIENLMKYQSWIQKVVSQNISDSVILIDTGCTNTLKDAHKFLDKYPESDQTYSNVLEVAILSKLVQTLIEMDVNPNNIGIITPYRAQVNLAKKIIQENVEINTVDQYQGRDKEIIFYSCTRSSVKNNNIKEDLEVLGDHRRLTVAVTRAK
nr:PREDICTED: DNA replication ATP-dependent helicase/nuclease DNA2-like isoform X3 [Megachile rotundata]